MSRLRARWEKIKTILKAEGMGALLKAIGLFVKECLYCRTVFSFGTEDWSRELDFNEADYRPNLDNHIITKLVYSNQEADQLEEEGFSFRNYPTDWNHDLALYTDWLNKGVIACCTFVGKELGAISWAVPSQEAQAAIKTYPLKVDYAKHEVFTRGIWTNPKYRGRGLWRYSHLCRNRLLLKAGINRVRSLTMDRSTAGRGLQKAFKSIIYGKGYEYKILWWKFWRAKYFGENEENDNTD